MARKRARDANRERDWRAALWFGGIALVLIVGVVWIGILPLLNGSVPYSGLRMMHILVLLGFAATFVTWIPHAVIIDDGYLANLRHEQNTAFTYWYLVVMVSVCIVLFGSAPAFPFADGYTWSDGSGIRLGRHRGSGPESPGLPLWFVATALWVACAFLLYRLVRGLLHRFGRPST